MKLRTRLVSEVIRLPCELLGTEVKYREGGQAIAKYAHACYSCMQQVSSNRGLYKP